MEIVLHFGQIFLLFQKMCGLFLITRDVGLIQGHNLKIGVRGGNYHTTTEIVSGVLGSVRKEGDVKASTA